LSAVGRVPFIKRRLVERAMGMSGEVPDFLRAEPPDDRPPQPGAAVAATQNTGDRS
jgi:hypothetical protein